MVTANNRSNSIVNVLRGQIEQVARSALCDVNEINWFIGFSGGKDSVALAHALIHHCELNPLTINLIHVNHGLSENADKWEQACIDHAAKWNVSLVVRRVDISPKSRTSIEAQARAARYKVLHEISSDADHSVLLFAHHLDDQLETLLLQLKRGAGPKGLSAMPDIQRRGEVIYARPWLHVEQTEIVEYVEAHQLTISEDESNLDCRYDRNFLRHQIIPSLKERWPGLGKAAARSASLCSEQVYLIEQFAQKWLEDALSEKGGINLPLLLAESTNWQAELIRYWCAQAGFTVPSKKQLDVFLSAIKSKNDKHPKLEYGQTVIWRAKGELFIREK